jgi:membrane-associated protease RseP (regulator of RpoE activity)
MDEDFGATDKTPLNVLQGSEGGERNQDALVRAAREVMDVTDVTLGSTDSPLRVRGRLNVPSEEAFTRLRPRFEAVGHTPLMRHEEGMDVIRALPTVYDHADRKFPTGAFLMLVLTILSVFITGVQQADGLYVGPIQMLIIKITGDASGVPANLLPTPEVWRNALWIGVQYTLALLGILGAHEMGHYIVARIHRVHTTWPFFIPMPFNLLGTMGAVIAMREPAPNRRIQFDIGVAGPLAGLIIAIPVMLIGLRLSTVGTAQDYLGNLPPEIAQNTMLLHEGQSLAYIGLKLLTFGRILPDGNVDVWVHPVALAAWAGLLVTALNLLPIGQLDGGHIMYGLFGDKAGRARRPIIAVLALFALVGTLRDTLAGAPPGTASPLLAIGQMIASLPLPGWSGWWIWIAMMVFLLRGHAPVLDEITGLDGRRKALGMAMLVVFILIFTPSPIVIEPLNLSYLIHWIV